MRDVFLFDATVVALDLVAFAFLSLQMELETPLNRITKLQTRE